MAGMVNPYTMIAGGAMTTAGGVAEGTGKSISLRQRIAAIKNALIALRNGQNERNDILAAGAEQVGNQGLLDQIAAQAASGQAAAQDGTTAGAAMAGVPGAEHVGNAQADLAAAQLFGNGISEAQAEAGTAFDNATGEQMAWNQRKLADVLREYQAQLDRAAAKGMRTRQVGRGLRAAGVQVARSGNMGSSMGGGSKGSGMGGGEIGPHGGSDGMMYGSQTGQNGARVDWTKYLGGR